MRKRNHIESPWTLLFGWSGVVCLLIMALTSCSSAQLAVDDAYHWPDRSAQTTTATTDATATSLPAEEGRSQASTIEYISVQDTTVTVKIKR